VAEDLSDRAVSAAVAVARGYGVEVLEPRVLSDRSNVMVELAPAPVVARVATSTADVRAGGARDWLARDVALGRFLASAGAEVVPPASEPPAGPHTEDGLAVAFWEMVEHDASRPPSAREAGEALRRLHEALAGFPGELPPHSGLLDECEAVIERLTSRAAAPGSPAAAPPTGSARPSGTSAPRSPAPASRRARSTATPRGPTSSAPLPGFAGPTSRTPAGARSNGTSPASRSPPVRTPAKPSTSTDDSATKPSGPSWRPAGFRAPSGRPSSPSATRGSARGRRTVSAAGRRPREANSHPRPNRRSLLWVRGHAGRLADRTRDCFL
jgi:hypothetical protein